MPNFNTNMFQRNADKAMKRSFKDLSHEWKHDFTIGNLIPCLAIQTLPGDDFEIQSQFFFKFDPLHYPAIHRMQLDCDFWWVRQANMWKAIGDADEGGWESFITLNESLEHPHCSVEMRDWGAVGLESDNHSVYGYCGVPYLVHDGDITRDTVITGLNAFLGMAYLQIYDQGYRHPQLEEARAQTTLTAGDNTALLQAGFDYYGTGGETMRVFPSKWGKDYFTSCLPEPQEGDPIKMPLVKNYDLGQQDLPTAWRKLDNTGVPSDGNLDVVSGNSFTQGVEAVGLDIQDTAPDIREFWVMSMLQTLKEQLLRWGNRYSDWLKASHDEDIDPELLGVPRMIGSYRGSVIISDTLTQADTLVGETEFSTGDYKGNASLFEQGGTIRFHCKDYGILMAIFTLTPNTGYGQGIPRWLRYNDPLDYPMDIFQGVGDQEILKEEVMYNNLTAQIAKNQETFGYGVRYQEAMTIPNNYGTNLAFRFGLSMHMGKWYDPLLTTGATYDAAIGISRSFLEANNEFPGGTRVSDVFKALPGTNGNSTENPVVGYIYHKIGAMRPLAAFSTPGTGL